MLLLSPRSDGKPRKSSGSRPLNFPFVSSRRPPPLAFRPPPPQAKVLAEEGLLDLVKDAWGNEASGRAHAHLEKDAAPYLPIDARAFALAVDGRLEPGGEVETNYGKAAVEVSISVSVCAPVCVCVGVRACACCVCVCLCVCGGVFFCVASASASWFGLWSTNPTHPARDTYYTSCVQVCT